MELANKKYAVILQCDIVMERCSGYFCEKAFKARVEGFEGYPKDKDLRSIYMTCGGCCGRGTHRKLSHLIRKLKEYEQVPKDQVIVQLASCITKDNYHAPKCPHLDYIKELLDKLDLDYFEDTHVDETSEAKRQSGTYK